MPHQCGHLALPLTTIVRLISYIVTIVISLGDVVDWLPKSRSSNNRDHNSPPNRANHIKSFLNTPGSSPHTRISFQLHNPNIVPYPAKFFNCPNYLCSGNNMMHLPHSLSQQAVLGFTTSISTDLNILFVGDSLSQQFVEAFDATLVPEGHELNRHDKLNFVNGGRGPQNTHSCLVLTAPVRGGGSTGYVRSTGLISTEKIKSKMNCYQTFDNGVWSPSLIVEKLLNHKYSIGDQSRTVNAFDAMIVRIPHGWMQFHHISKEDIIEMIHTSNKYIGAEVVVISTLPLNNNVVSESDWEKVIGINQMIREIANDWNVNRRKRDIEGTTGPQWVLVQEFGMFTNQIMALNAQHMGYNVSLSYDETSWERHISKALLHRFDSDGPSNKWPKSIPMVCGSSPTKNHTYCPRNKISPDGMHWCMEYLGSRLSTSIACLLGCAFNGKGVYDDFKNMQVCQKVCNDSFMSVAPVDHEWVDNDVTIYSM